MFQLGPDCINIRTIFWFGFVSVFAGSWSLQYILIQICFGSGWIQIPFTILIQIGFGSGWIQIRIMYTVLYSTFWPGLVLVPAGSKSVLCTLYCTVHSDPDWFRFRLDPKPFYNSDPDGFWFRLDPNPYYVHCTVQYILIRIGFGSGWIQIRFTILIWIGFGSSWIQIRIMYRTLYWTVHSDPDWFPFQLDSNPYYILIRICFDFGCIQTPTTFWSGFVPITSGSGFVPLRSGFVRFRLDPDPYHILIRILFFSWGLKQQHSTGSY